MKLRELFEGLNKEQKKWLYSQLSDLKYNRHKWAEIFNHKYRLYFPYEGEYKSNINDSLSYNHVSTVIERLGELDGDIWEVEDYLKGIASRKQPTKVPIDRIAKFLNRPDLLDLWNECRKGYIDNTDNMSQVMNLLTQLKKLGYDLDPSTEETFINGIFTKFETKRVSIGKLLEKAIQHKLADSSILQAYAQDPYRTGARTKLNVVISRHPEDIGSMSTNRRWDSCMNLVAGVNKKYVPMEIAEGSLVAYLINENDRKIDAPLARILIKPFINIKDGTVALGVQDKIYPSTGPKAFGEQVSAWANSINDSKQLNGIFIISGKAYNDDRGKTILRVGDMEGNEEYLETMPPALIYANVTKIKDAVENYLYEIIGDMEMNDYGYHEYLMANYADEDGDIDYDLVHDEEVSYADYNPDIQPWFNEVIKFFHHTELLDDIYSYAKNYVVEFEEVATVEQLPSFLSELAEMWYRHRLERKSEIVNFINDLKMVQADNGDWEVKV